MHISLSKGNFDYSVLSILSWCVYRFMWTTVDMFLTCYLDIQCMFVKVFDTYCKNNGCQTLWWLQKGNYTSAISGITRVAAYGNGGDI